MTASWGGLGTVEKNVAFIVVRPQRYTKEFIDASSTFSLSFFDKKYVKNSLLWKIFWKRRNKIEKCNFTVGEEKIHLHKTTNLVMICKKIFRATLYCR